MLTSSQGPVLLPPLLSLPKLSPPLLGADTSPPSLQTLLHRKLHASLSGLWSFPAPKEDDEGHDVTPSAHCLACHQLTPYCSICSLLCTGCIIVVDMFAGGHKTGPAFIPPAQFSCSSLCCRRHLPSQRSSVPHSVVLAQKPLGLPREGWGLI